MSTQSQDQQWVAEAARGDQAAFRALYQAHVRPVYWIAHGILSSAPDAEDVTQETFVVAWRRLAELDLAGESALPWLATICRFTAANLLRKRRRERAVTSESLDESIPSRVSVEETVISVALAERIAEEVGTLSELDRDILQLCAADGLSYEDAAHELGVSHGTVRNRLSRTRTHLRAVVQKEERA